MFYFYWALKNLYRNIKRTLGLSVFVVIISLILFLNFAFLKGTQVQMEETTRKFVGDISFDLREEDSSLVIIKDLLEGGKYKDMIEMIVSEYTLGNVRVISEQGYLDEALVSGYSLNYFKWMGKSVDWIAGNSSINSSFEAIIEKSVAEDLGIMLNDKIIVEYISEKGAINTATYKVNGIFIGNKYIHTNAIYIRLQDAQNLALFKNNKINHLKIFLKDFQNDELYQKIINEELKDHTYLAHLSIWKWEPEKNMFFNVFQYGQLFIKTLVTMVSIVLLIVLFFGIQNSFFITFNKRSNEISVLVTYGMPFLKIYRLVFWETIILFFIGISAGFLLSLCTGHILTGVNMAQISNEMIVILGGPNIVFNFKSEIIGWISLFLLIVGLYSSMHSLRKYFKVEISEMEGGLK